MSSELHVALDFLGSKEIIVEATAGQLTSDAGFLPFRQLDERFGLTQHFAAALTDARAAGCIDPTCLEMVRMRVRRHPRGGGVQVHAGTELTP